MAVMERPKELPGLEPLYSVCETAEYLGLTEQAVYLLVNSNPPKLRAAKMQGSGRRKIIRIPASSLREYVAGK